LGITLDTVGLFGIKVAGTLVCLVTLIGISPTHRTAVPCSIDVSTRNFDSDVISKQTLCMIETAHCFYPMELTTLVII
jgi:hypothetical protein